MSGVQEAYRGLMLFLGLRLHEMNLEHKNGRQMHSELCDDDVLLKKLKK